MEQLASGYDEWAVLHLPPDQLTTVAPVIPGSTVSRVSDLSVMQQNTAWTFFYFLLCHHTKWLSQFLLQITCDLQNKLQGECLDACLRISVNEPAPES